MSMLWGVVGYESANIIKETLREELDRNLRSQHAYEIEIGGLPRGSVSVRMRGEHEYCYLKYRDGRRTITEYVGPASRVERGLREQVRRRKEAQAILKRLKHEQAFIEKALRHR